MLDDLLHPNDGDADEEPKPASMAMTKAELLERLHEAEDDLTKAEILERIRELEDGEGPSDDATAMPPDMRVRTVTIDSVKYVWTQETEDTVPEAAREAWAQSQAAGG